MLTNEQHLYFTLFRFLHDIIVATIVGKLSYTLHSVYLSCEAQQANKLLHITKRET